MDTIKYDLFRSVVRLLRLYLYGPNYFKYGQYSQRDYLYDHQVKLDLD